MLEWRVVAKVLQVLEHPDECLLRDIFELVIVPRETRRPCRTPSAYGRRDQLRERVIVARERGSDQIFILMAARRCCSLPRHYRAGKGTARRLSRSWQDSNIVRPQTLRQSQSLHWPKTLPLNPDR
jgi:hypothetical protein